ncbi:MAG: DUF4430 domain-containing protein [Ruminococcaceae bacterium]|nr:DUF4430 domain-containing protein [Oscillospiraceae bacterium]
MKKNFQRLIALVLCTLLIAATAVFASGCTNETGGAEKESEEKTFTFIVVDKDGNETSFEITTCEKKVGEALLKEGLIEGEEGAFGLYVKKVHGITADYEKDKTYWSFYINGEYAMTGVDMTDIEDGAVYSMKVES